MVLRMEAPLTSAELEEQTVYSSIGDRISRADQQTKRGGLLADGRALSGDQTPLTVAFHEDVGAAGTARLDCPDSRTEVVNSALETAVSP